MEVDLSNPSVALNIKYRNSYVGPSPGLTSPSYPRAFTSTFASEVTNAKAAINGTYFNTANYDSANPATAWGGGTTYLRANGSTIHTFDGSDVNRHSMGLLFNSRNDVTLMRKSGGWNARASSWQNMMVSGPVLLVNGVVETYTSTNDHANLRHPRSAIGKINASNKLLLVTVDGRHEQAAGMSCTELAQVMKALGCDNAINLDGGGSTTLWGAGEPNSGVLNYPTDNGEFDHAGQRRAANALVVTSANPVTAPFDARLTSLSYNTLTRSGETVTVTARYTNVGSSSWTSSNVRVVPSRVFGRTSAFIPGGGNFATMSPATVAPGATATFTLSLVSPAVASTRNYSENFALWQTTNGYFGPPDDDLQVNLAVRPPLTGAPQAMIVQGTSTGPNNQWYTEPTSNWGSSSVSFTAAGVNNSGSQRYAAATSTNRYADFKPIFDVAGVYRVEASWPYSSNNIDTVTYTVNHMGGTNTLTRNQNSSGLGNSWQLLGQYAFSTGSSGNMGVHSVRVGNGSKTGNRFYSGALRFDYVGPLAGVNDWPLY